MSFPRYPAYKPSGVEWLGEVPEHWDVLPCRGIVDERNEKNEGAACQDYPSLMANVGIIPYEEKGDIGNKKPEDLGKCKLVRKGDFVINSMNYGIGSYGVSGYDGVCSPVYIVLIPKEEVVRPGFAFRIFEDKTFQSYAQSFGNGILAHRCAIGWDILKGIGVPLPSSHEQERILQFLDHETAKIDALIAEQQRLIELLQEKRQAVISHAVTKGLNQDAPMKDSGVEWLGEVPEHWAMSPIKYLARVGNGSTPNRDNPEYWVDDGFPWLNSSVVNKAEVLEAERFVTRLALKECHLPIVEPPAALVGITGQGRTRGMAAQLMFTATVNQHVAFIKPSTNRITVDYLLRVLEASYDRLRLDSEGSGSTKGAITCEQLGLWSVPLPDYPEQEEIVSFLKVQVEMHESLKAESERAIALLQERRSALISAAVTGQIDVRELVPRHDQHPQDDRDFPSQR